MLVIKVQRSFPANIFEGFIAIKSRGIILSPIKREKRMYVNILTSIKIEVTLR